MKRIIALFVLTLSLGTGWSQNVDGTEFGIDAYFGASTFGGTFSLGPKYGLKFGENFITGPSLRYQRTWNNNPTTGVQGGFNVFGGGAFAHGRFYNALFLGMEFEMMRTPINGFGQITSQGSWVPTLFIGGGYSQEFNESVRINAGVMLDVIDHVQSPFRGGYFMRRSNGSFIPLIYRLAFFFPLS